MKHETINSQSRSLMDSRDGMSVKHKNWITMSLFSLLLAVGCAKEKSGSSSAVTPGGVTPVPVTTTTVPATTTGVVRDDKLRGTEFMDGAIATVQLEGNVYLQSYAATHPINNPSDFKISVRLSDHGGGRWGGRVMFSYYDNNQFFTGKFLNEAKKVATDCYRSCSDGYDGWDFAEYNRWFTWPDKTGKQVRVFHGFFSDQYGAVMLIIDDSIDQGDGAGPDSLAGEFWFKNHATTSVQPSNLGIPCWFITQGPYDCRTFLGSDGRVNTFSAVYPYHSLYSDSANPNVENAPSRGWRRLGKFSGLSFSKAFGGN